MSRFSERNGIVLPPRTLQVESMSDELRNSIWNLIILLYSGDRESYWNLIAKLVAIDFRRVPVDELPLHDFQKRDWLKKYFYSLDWWEVYDLLEFLATQHDHPRLPLRPELVRRRANEVLERELSGYRFVDQVLVPIADSVQIDAINDALEASVAAGLTGAYSHVQSALSHFGKRPDPDYRNAVKEAISGVESAARIISGEKSKTLDPALKALSEKTEIHRALQSAFSKLYGYTSDDDGIRHAIINEARVGFAEAKYMIVACSAFISYLIEKSGAAGDPR